MEIGAIYIVYVVSITYLKYNMI